MFSLYNEKNEKAHDGLSIPELISYCKMLAPEGLYTVFFDGMPIMRLYNHYVSYEYEVTIILLAGTKHDSYYAAIRKPSYIDEV